MDRHGNCPAKVLGVGGGQLRVLASNTLCRMFQVSPGVKVPGKYEVRGQKRRRKLGKACADHLGRLLAGSRKKLTCDLSRKGARPAKLSAVTLMLYT